MEAMESRVLLSAYALSQAAYLGVNASGADPRSTLVADSSGNLYGTAAGGGSFGAGNVFEIAKGSTAITTLVSFDYAHGARPDAGVVFDGSGNLYGTTSSGGSYDDGTVFEIARGSNSLTTIASLNGADGQDPEAAVTLDASGNLYGTAQDGGSNGDGTVFEIANGSNAITVIASFAQTNGAHPVAPVTLDASGNLYGTTTQYGASGPGSVFEIAKGSTAITTLVSFNGSNGDSPEAGLSLDASGNLFGTTSNGPGGTVFEIANGSTAITTIASFNAPQAANGGVTLDGSGDIFGTTSAGGTNNDGSVFEIAHGSSAITTLASFNGSNGATPQADLTLDASGNIFGTTYEGLADGINGGAFGYGTVFEIAKGSATITTVASFDHINAMGPSAGLTLDQSGNLYGTSQGGGAYNDGTVYEIAKGSTRAVTVASFNGINGDFPFAPVTFDTSGNLYGTTYQGGASGLGTVFEIAWGSTAITTVASFNGGNGNSPYAGVTLDASGNIYGTTYGGGANNDGTAFEIASGSTAITTLASFDGTNGGDPRGPVTLDGAGDLYGTTVRGGPADAGTVFEIARGSNTITTLVAFDGADGQAPAGTLVRDSSGDLYGTTYQGGNKNDGTVFEIPKGATTVSTLASFDGTNGSFPLSGVSMDLSGNLYGTTVRGGGSGGVFELARGSSTITTLASFSPRGTDGAYPDASVTLDEWGNIYGTSSEGGADADGTVFKLTANAAVALAPAGGPNPSNSNHLLTFTATVTGGAPDGEIVNLVDTTNNNAVVATGTLSNGSATLTVPAGTFAVGVHNLIAAYGGDANFAAAESAPYAQTVIAPSSLPSYVTPSVKAVYSYDSSTGALSLTSGTLTFTADNTAAPLINLTASGSASGLFFKTSEHLAGLSLSGGAQATALSLGSARTHSNHNVLVIGTLGSANDPTFSIDPSSKLDLTDNDLIVHTGSSDSGNGVPNQLGVPETNELATVQGLAVTGRGVKPGGVLDGTWIGNGLTSSSAASADAAAGYEQNVLAVVQNSDQVLGKLSAWTVGSFSEPLGANDILVKYTYNGDAALEGYVGDDSVTIVNGFYDAGKSTQNDWAFGDFTGNGKVNDDDITILNGLYGNGTAASGLPQL